MKGTNLSYKDIKNKFTITALSTPTGNEEDCVDISTKTSWDDSKAIYLCMRSDGTSNLATIDPSKYSNKTYVSNEPYYFKGLDPNNYVKLPYRDSFGESEGTFRIIYIDRNDDIIIKSKYRYKIFSVESKSVSPVGFICMTDSGVENQKFAEPKYLYVHCSSWLGTVDDYTNDKKYRSNIYINRLTNVKIISGTGAEDNPFILENKS